MTVSAVLSGRRVPVGRASIFLAVALIAGVVVGWIGAELRIDHDPLVQVRTPVSAPDGGVLVWSPSVITVNGQAVVYVEVAGRVYRQPVQIVQSRQPGFIDVVSGLSRASHVVLDPVNVHDGERIRPVIP